MPPIVANSVLPAHREPLSLLTGDGLRLVGELASPVAGRPVATLVCVHPLPTAGGMMDSHVLRKAAWRLPALVGVAVLRFNTRGTSSAAGTSEGTFDASGAEGLDLAAAIAEVGRRGLPAPWLLGWSFGTDVVLRHGDRDPVRGAILLSPPLRWSTDDDLDHWAGSGRPLVCLVPELDDNLRPDDARARFARVPQAVVEGIAGARHLWLGEPSVRTVLDRVADVVVPGSAPLPREWDGPATRWDDLAAIDGG
ncbi:MAG: alpha/beta hydrolase [Actinomycetota bacterium]|nr:MAG: alpha/beta hydrolase [Actinomycetota bacterium]